MFQKNFILTLALCLVAACINAQTSSTVTFAFNAEQIMDKVGMQKLFDLFDKSTPAGDASKKEQRKKVQKAIAALYGAGIDFSKKIWVVEKQTLPENLSVENYSRYEPPTFTLIIPVANRQVFEEQLSILANNDLQFTKRGNYSYVIKNKSLFVLTDKEFFIHNLPEKFSWLYNDIEYYGTPIKADTVAREKNLYEDVVITDSIKEEKAPYTEIDKILPTGKVQRVYFYKEPKYDYATIPPPPEMTAAVDSTAAMVDSISVIKDEEVMPDTMTYTKYLNDSVQINYQYIPYTDAEREAHLAQIEIKKIADREQEAFKFMDSCRSLIPYYNATEANLKMLQSKDDIIMYSNASNISGSFKKLSAVFGSPLSAISTGSQLSQNYNSFMAVNFNTGHTQIKIFSDSAKNEYNKLYKQVTAFWPKELGDGKLGRIRFNFNTGMFMEIINNYVAMMKPYMRSKSDTILKLKWNDMFTGEIAASFITPSPKKTKKEPRLLIAFGVNDTKLAVQTLNNLSSEKLRGTKSYRFDVNGKYLLLDTDGEIGAKMISAPATVIAPKLNSNYGEVFIDLRNLIINSTKTAKRNTKDFKTFTSFFNTISMVSDKTDTEGLVVDMKIDMGDKTTNSLYNLIKLMSDENLGKKKLK